MKTFNTPYVEVIKFNVADVITASTEEEDDIPMIGNCMPLDP